MALGADQITVTTHDIFRPEVWSPRVQRATEAQLHLASFVYRRDSEIKGYGDVLNTQTISNLSANNKTGNAQVTLQTPTESNVPLTINKHKEASFLVEDITEVQTMVRLQREYSQKAGYGVGKQVDTDVFANYGSLSESAIGTAGSALTDAVIVSAWSTLSGNDVPEEDRGWFFHPSAYADILKLDKFVRMDFKTNIFEGSSISAALKSKAVGTLYGAPVFLTTNVPSYSTGSPAFTAYRNLYLHKEAFQLAMQKGIRTQTDYILEYLGYLTVVDAIYGTSIYRADHGIEIDR